ncbi:MAG: class I adenylate-forming enzyme family protein, partial [Sulfitobacter sp.]
MSEDSTSAPLRFEHHYGDRVVACYADRPPNVYGLLRDAVARYPDNTALICDDTRLTYAELDTEVRKVAAGLAARGVGCSDRVAMLLGNGTPFVVVTYAAAFLGAVTVPLNTRDQMPGIRHALQNSDAMALIVDAEFCDLVPPPGDTPTLTAKLSVGEATGFDAYETLLHDAPAANPTLTDEEAAATILYTSGTTGTPKGATLTGLGIIHSATNFMQAMALGPTDRTVVVVPMNHVTGLVAGIHTLVRCAGCIVVMRTFKAVHFLECAA